MNRTHDCEGVRTQLMVALDGEAADQSPLARQHLAECSACQAWLRDLESVAARLQGLPYPQTGEELWSAVGERIHQLDQGAPLTPRLLAIAALVMAWRALQLSLDLPLPILHPIVPLAAAAWAVWQVAGDPLAIETSAPELQK